MNFFSGFKKKKKKLRENTNHLSIIDNKGGFSEIGKRTDNEEVFGIIDKDSNKIDSPEINNNTIPKQNLNIPSKMPKPKLTKSYAIYSVCDGKHKKNLSRYFKFSQYIYFY